MMELIPMQSDNAIGLKISGKIQKQHMEKATNAVKEMMNNHDHIRIYVEIESYDGFSFGALVEDIKFGIPNLKKFTKEAVVSDKKWIKSWISVADKLFPSIEIRHFSPEDKTEALRWVQE